MAACPLYGQKLLSFVKVSILFFHAGHSLSYTFKFLRGWKGAGNAVSGQFILISTKTDFQLQACLLKFSSHKGFARSDHQSRYCLFLSTFVGIFLSSFGKEIAQKLPDNDCLKNFDFVVSGRKIKKAQKYNFLSCHFKKFCNFDCSKTQNTWK